MKRIVLYVSCCVLLTSQLYSQQNKRVSLDLGGMTLWLGMPKQDVLAKIAENSLKIQATKSAGASSMAVAFSEKHVYTVAFTADRLVYADRSWASEDEDRLESAIKALTAVTQDKDSLCTVSHQPTVDPTMSANRVFISCGQRSVLLTRMKIGDKWYSDISERIGDLPNIPG